MAANNVYAQGRDPNEIPFDSTVTPDFDPKTWDMPLSLALSRQLTTGRTLCRLAEEGRDDIVVCTADLGRPTQVQDFAERYPDRFYNFGIAERNMISAAAGLATTGALPFISNYAFFLALMGCENIRNDICYTDLPVRMVGTHSGIAMGFYGTSHHSCEDIGVLRTIPNLTLMAPCDGTAISALIRNTIDHPHPLYFRAGRGRETQVYDQPFEARIGGSNVLREGGDTAIFAVGIEVAFALDAAERLSREHGIEATVIDCYSIRPLDTETVCAHAGRHTHVFTAEEHNVTGGFASAVAETLALNGMGTRLHPIGMPDAYSILGPPTHLYQHYALDGAGIARRVAEVLKAA